MAVFCVIFDTMKKVSVFLTLLLLALGFTSCKQQTSASTPAQVLLERMTALSEKGIMYGHQDDPFYGITWQWERDRSDTKELCGDYPAVMGFDLGGLEEHHDKNLDSVPFAWIREEAVRHFERGGIITFSWHPRNPRTGGTAWDTTDSTVVRNLLVGGEQHELFSGWMADVAVFLQSLKTTDNQPVSFIFRPWHEYNGSWFWWGYDLCSDDEYLTLWSMFQDYMNQMLPGQIVWSQSPNLQGNWTDETFLPRFAGAERVDILGLDCYQWGSEEEYISGASADAQYLSQLAHRLGLLFAFTECGRVNSDIPDWWSRIFMPITVGTHACYFLPWRNWHEEHFGASADASTASDFLRLANEHQFLLLQDIK